MSLSSLADQEIIRTEDRALKEQLRPRVSGYANAMVQKFQISPEKALTLTDDLLPLAAQPPIEPSKGSDALNSLVRYIPTEAITLYVAACSAITSLKGKLPNRIECEAYWFFVVLTPTLFLLIYMGKRRGARLSALPRVIEWPWWPLIASTVAFAVWALAVPTTPYLTGEVGGVVAAFLAVFVSTFLTLLEPIFQPKP